MVLTVKALLVAILLGVALLLLGLGLKLTLPGVVAMAVEALLGLLLPPLAFPLFAVGAGVLLCLTPAKSGSGESGRTEGPIHVITALSGPLQGRSFSLTAREPQLTFGRENCSVLFPTNTPGVGRHHCRVYLRGDTACLEDERSTYGTFLLPGGQRVTPGQPVPLSDGTRFCLASPAVTFQYSNTH